MLHWWGGGGGGRGGNSFFFFLSNKLIRLFGRCKDSKIQELRFLVLANQNVECGLLTLQLAQEL